MEPKNPERSNTNNFSPSHYDEHHKEEDDGYKPMDIQRKGKTTTLKTFMNDDLKKLAEAASKKNGY